MMKLTYRRAILSFCEDLTDPNARAWPVGVLLIGDLTSEDGKPNKLDQSRWGAAVVLQPDFGNPFIAEHLSDALAIVKEHIDRAVHEKPDAPSDEILHALYTKLRNSLFVSSVSEQPELVEVHAVNEELYGSAMLDLANRELQKEVRTLVEDLKQNASAPTARTTVRSQQTEVWELH